MDKPRLGVIYCSTREQRAGTIVADWALDLATQHGGFTVEYIDLKALALPPLDEPNHPTFKKYVHEHTKKWSAQIEALDAFLFVLPEYNHAMPPALLNALDYLVHEWAYKAAAFVTYGGVSAGTRSLVHTKMVLVALKLVPLVEGVNLPFFTKMKSAEGKLEPGEVNHKAGTKMLDELARWTTALKTLRS